MILTSQLFLFQAFSQTSASHKGDSPGQDATALEENTPEQILTVCARYALDLDPVDRAFLLVRVSQAAASIQYGKSTEWARQAFDSAAALPKDWNRVALQKNALLALAKTRPREALQLLGTIEGPDLTSAARPGEDPRAHAAREIFPEVYNTDGDMALQSLEEVSRYLGQTGEFPYAAWGELFPKLSEKNPDAFREQLNLSIYFYSRAENRFRTQDGDYLEMVDDIQKVAVPSDIRRAVEVALDHVELEKIPDNEKHSAILGPAGAGVSFSDPITAMLYSWLPLVQKFDPDRYKEVSSKVNAPAPKDVPALVSSEIVGDASNISAKVRKMAADRLQAQVVIDDAASSPETALMDASTIGSPAIRADALAQAALNVPESKRDSQQKLLDASKSSLAQADVKDAAYLHALSDLTNSYYRLGRKSEALDGIKNGLDLGAEIVSESEDTHPGTPTLLLGGYDALAQLVSIGMALDPGLVLRSVRNLKSEPVRANLMVDIAVAMGTQNLGAPA